MVRISKRVPGRRWPGPEWIIAPIIIAVATSGHASAKPLDCKQFLIGRWSGQGTVEPFNVKVDNAYRYDADGTVEAVNRFLGKDGKWQEQRTRGTWTTTPGTKPNSCDLTSTSEDGTFKTTTDFIIVDRDTWRSIGIDIKRVK